MGLFGYSKHTKTLLPIHSNIDNMIMLRKNFIILTNSLSLGIGYAVTLSIEVTAKVDQETMYVTSCVMNNPLFLR